MLQTIEKFRSGRRSKEKVERLETKEWDKRRGAYQEGGEKKKKGVGGQLPKKER